MRKGVKPFRGVVHEKSIKLPPTGGSAERRGRFSYVGYAHPYVKGSIILDGITMAQFPLTDNLLSTTGRVKNRRG